MYVSTFAAKVVITQYEYLYGTGPDNEFLVEGVASIVPPRHFAFNCRSDSNSGRFITWVRVDENQAASFIQRPIKKGVQLDFDPTVSTDAGYYACWDTSNDDKAYLEITTGK